MHQTKTGILLANLGTPDAPTPGAVKRYLRQFLSDKRVVDTSRLLWWPLLRGVILPIRSPAWRSSISPSGWKRDRR
jgi:ferrochelatase